MWNDNIYRMFYGDRIQPSIDLVNRINVENCEHILDIGCGSGMSTMVLKNNYPNAKKIVGIDLSKEMLAEAKKQDADIVWIEKNCSESLEEFGKFDIVFSNAFLQWLSPDEQKSFLNNSVKNVSEKGVFAIQIPNYDNLPVAKCCKEVNEKWAAAGKLIITEKCMNYTPEEYYDMISTVYSDVVMWTTTYYQKMKSVSDIIQFVKGTAIRQAAEQLSQDEWKIFADELEEKLGKHYHTAKDGTVFFPFERIFIIAKH